LAKASSSRYSSGELSTILGADAVLEGRLTVKNAVRVDGVMRGEIQSSDNVTIGKDGSVEGDITAADVVIGGKVTGRVLCQGKVVLEENSTLTGDLKTIKLVVEEGAVFNGMSEMGEDKFQQQRTYQPKVINLQQDEDE
jgi:cytoskeletal protein CcmA (bactofilin family)